MDIFQSFLIFLNQIINQENKLANLSKMKTAAQTFKINTNDSEVVFGQPHFIAFVSRR